MTESYKEKFCPFARVMRAAHHIECFGPRCACWNEQVGRCGFISGAKLITLTPGGVEAEVIPMIMPKRGRPPKTTTEGDVGTTT